MKQFKSIGTIKLWYDKTGFLYLEKGDFKLTRDMVLNGGTNPLTGKFFKPNGTGPESVFGSKILGDGVRELIKRFSPVDRYKQVGVGAHDWLYELAFLCTRKTADRIMGEINEIERDVKNQDSWVFEASRKVRYFFVSRFGGGSYKN